MKVSWRIIDLTLRYQALVLALGIVAALLAAPGLTLGIAAGGAIAIANIFGSRVVLPRAVHAGQLRLGYSLLMMVKFGFTFALLAAAFLLTELEPLGLAAGFGGTFFLGTGFALIHTMTEQPTPKTHVS